MKTFYLVYQAGIANLFEAAGESAAIRKYQGDFRTAEAMARGAVLGGAAVKVASCNVAGDVTLHTWTKGMSACPFRNEANPPTERTPAPTPAPIVHIEVVPHAEIANTLERLIDCVTLGRTIAALADVCYAKAEHVRGNWQDRALALQWNIAAKRLEKANEGIIEL